MAWRWFPPIVTGCFVMAGTFKSAPILQSLPIDLTLAMAVLTVGAMGWVAISTWSIPRAAVTMVIPFILLATVLLWTTSSSYGFTKVGQMFTLTLLAGLAPAMLIRSRDDASRFLGVWIVLCAIHAFGSFVAPQQDYEGAPLMSFANNTIALGETSAVVLAATTISLVWRRVPVSLAIPVMLAMAFALLNSGSRGPLLGVVIALLVSTLLIPGRRRVSVTILAAVVVAAGIVYAFSQAPLFAQARIGGLLEGNLDTSSQTRLELYALAVRSITEHPFGTGWGGFAAISRAALPYPHNLVLEVLAEGGLVIGGAFLVWLVQQFLRARHIATDFIRCLTLALVTLFMFLSLVTGDLREQRGLFFALGIAAANYGLRSSAGAQTPPLRRRSTASGAT